MLCLKFTLNTPNTSFLLISLFLQLPQASWKPEVVIWPPTIYSTGSALPFNTASTDFKRILSVRGTRPKTLGSRNLAIGREPFKMLIKRLNSPNKVTAQEQSDQKGNCKPWN